MKKITFLLFALLFSFVGYSQFPTPGTEGFETSGLGPDLPVPVASSPWTLGTGATGNQWAVFDNGVPAPSATQRRWTFTAANAYAGNQAAFMNRKQNGGAGVTSDDYLATPKITVPSNGQLTFYTRQGFVPSNNVNYYIKINTNVTTPGSQTTAANYVLPAATGYSWDQTTIAATYNIYELKTVDLSAYSGQQVYIAFVRSYTQPAAAISGNSWYVDEVKLVERCLDPTNLSATNIGLNSANLNWANPSGSTSWEIEVTSGTPTGVGVIYNGTLPYIPTNLIPGTCYVYYVRSKCLNSTSQWVGPFNFCTSSPGLTCTAPIQVTSLPYNTTDNTTNYGNTYSTAQPSTCAGTAVNYMAGNDVFYSYTPTTNGAISITMTPATAAATNSGIFVYDGCANLGVTCLAGVANATTNVRDIPSLNVIAGHTYIIVLSSSAATTTYPYNLVIQQLNCAAPTGLAATNITTTGAQLSWTNPTSSLWQYVVQLATLGIPSGAGTTTSSSTNTPVSNLTPGTQYEYWVRADCDGGGTTFSPWVGPFLFATPLCNNGCNYVFTLSDSFGDSWSGNTMSVIQNGVTVATLTGPTTAQGTTPVPVNVSLCPGPFQLFWNAGGTFPTDVGVSITSFLGDLLYTHAAGTSLQNSLLYSDTANCTVPTCPRPNALVTSAVTDNSGTLSWTNNSTGSLVEVLYLPCGTFPTATSTGVQIPTTNTYTFTGLAPLTCYNLFVRSICSITDTSSWTPVISITTLAAPPVCGGQYVNVQGATTGTYPANSDSTIIICPTNPTDVVTVTFTSFATEATWDGIYVFDGNSITAPQISSGNGAGNVPGGVAGSFWGTLTGTNLPTFTSTNTVGTGCTQCGCLTFRFRSDASVSTGGWVANVTCAPPPTCKRPTALTSSNVLPTTALLSWTQAVNPDGSIPSQWKVIAVPCNSPIPTATTTGWQTVTTNPATITGLAPDTCYDFYVLNYCSTTDSSIPSTPTTATTPPTCTRPTLLSSSNVLPTTAVLTWTQLANPDGSIPSSWQVIALPNGSAAPTSATPGWQTVTTNPATITGLLPDTCYNFYVLNHCSATDLSIPSLPTSACTPPTCPKPTAVAAGATSATSASISWTENGTATSWQVIALPAGSAAPTASSPWSLPTTNNPYILSTGLTTGTFYDVYVRAICTLGTDISTNSLPASLYINPPLPSCAGVDLTVATSSPGVINVCPDNNCVNLSASYTDTYTTSSYTVGAIAYSPPFPFVGGTQVSVNTDDVWSGNVAIPFKFCFYGNTYNSLNIGSNGVVTFNNQAAGSFCNWSYTATIPSTTFPILNAIYAPYQDTNPSILTPPAQPNVNYQILGTAPCRVVVINFSQVAQFSCGTSVGLQTSQLVLYETSNVIDIYVKNRTSCTTWNSGSGLIGIQNAAGTLATVPPGRNTGQWSATNEAWRFLPAGPSNVTFSWLQNGTTLTTNTSTTVCPTTNTTMTAQAIYTQCDGTQVIKSQNVLLNIINQITPAFTPISPLCQNATAPTLPLVSNDVPQITGSWSPATIDTSVVGTTVYTFTPDAGQCAIPTTMSITILPIVTPTFNAVGPLCINSPAPTLPLVSTNTTTPVSGTWTPATIDTSVAGTTIYTFTPATGQCATPTTLSITVNPCQFGAYASAVWLTNCSTSNFFNTVGSGADIIGPIANVFPSTNLGTYVQNSGALLLKGAEVKTFKNSSSNVCSAHLNYRIYPGTSATGAFQVMNLPFFSNCGSGSFINGGGPCNAGDQKWQKVLPNVLYPAEVPVDLTAYPPGNYSVQVYYDITGSATSTSGCTDTILMDNGGAYYTATFTIQAQPSYASTNPTTCTGLNGTITISGMAPNSAYGVSYNSGSTAVGPTSLTSNSAGQIIITGLSAGTYSNFLVTINGCSYTYTTPIVLIDPTPPSVTVNSPVACSSLPASVAATPNPAGSYNYVWTVPSGPLPGNVSTFNTSIAGTYSVIITDIATGCSSTSGSGIVSFSTLIPPTFNAIAPICKGATAPALQTSSTNSTPIVGTWLPATIDSNALGNTTYTFTPNAGQCSNPISIVVTVNATPTPTATVVTQPTCTTPTGTAQVTSPLSVVGTPAPTDLFISEVTDSNTGALSYIELFNGTGATVNLADYTIKTANNGNGYTFNLPLNSGSLATGNTYVVALGIGGSSVCNAITGGDGSLAAQSSGSGSVNFTANGNDHFGLFHGTTQIDSWGTFGNSNWAPSSIGTEGADFRRKNTISPLPNTNYSDSDWDILDYAGTICANNDYSNIGIYSMPTTTVTYQYSVDGGTYQSSPIFTGLTPGVHTITVQDIATGCTSSITVTVNPLPALPIISGTLSACIGNTTQLLGNGTAASINAWTSSNFSVATIYSTGLVTGVSAGTSIITYTNSDGCQITATVTINALPIVSGALSACMGNTTQLSGNGTAATTNAWTSSNTSVATIDSTGLVTGVAAGTSIITYTNSDGCQITATVTINALPIISGTLSACIGNTTQLSGNGTAATTNAWTSSNTSVATIDSTGLVTGVSAGTSIITYTNNDGCQITATVTINALPIISGTLSACVGNTTQLSGDGTAATTSAWASSNTSVATIDNTGLVTGVSSGTSIITYTNSGGCQITATATINALPIISGTLSACVGNTTQLSGNGTAATTNAWASSNTSIATIDNTGLVTGVSAGTSIITYTNSDGCQITATVTLNALPIISGTLSACIGNTTQLSGNGTAATTNAWTSSNTSVATIDSTGLVTGVSAGTSIITYTNSDGCQITATVSINALPIISGTLSACVGNITQLSGNGAAATTNAWTSSNTSVATIDSTGLVTGVSAGTAIITYTNSNGCQTTATVTINALPSMTGTLSACVGSTTQLNGSGTSASTNAWTSSNTAVATINNSGLVTGVSAGTSIITYTNSNGCQITATVTVNPIPTVTVTGSTVCQGSQATITANATPAGTYNYVWSGPDAQGNVATFTTAIAGTYSVIITNSTTGCTSSSASGTAAFFPSFDFTLFGECLDSKFTLEVIPTGNSFDLNTSDFYWTYNGVQVGSNNPTFDVTTFVSGLSPIPSLPITFSVKVKTNDGCEQTHPITLDRIYCDIQRGISPNPTPDGKNDFFDLRLMNVQTLSIFNRYGTKVYTKGDYTNEWIGQSDAGNDLPDGTYYYVIEFKNNQSTKTGWIYINRENK